MQSFKKVVNIDLSEKALILSAVGVTHKNCFIFLHGLGMSVQKFFEVFLNKDMIGLLDTFKIVIPQAPIRKVEMKGGAEDFSWYNPKILTTLTEETCPRIMKIIEEEAKLLNNDYKSIFLGGFSQGAGVSLHLRSIMPYKIGGTILVGGFKSDYTEIKEDADFSNTLIIHGTEDEAIKIEDAKKMFKDLMTKPGVETFFIEGMEHNLYRSDMRRRIAEFLKSRAKE